MDKNIPAQETNQLPIVKKKKKKLSLSPVFGRFQ
jgi:hypothetical protein